jgi:hypothetical protein
MVTKPTGRLPGRPKKQSAPKAKRPSRGQPRKPLTAWPNRYKYAFAEGFMKYQAETQGISRNRSTVAAAMLFVSEIELTPAYIAALRGDSFKIRPRTDCYRTQLPSPSRFEPGVHIARPHQLLDSRHSPREFAIRPPDASLEKTDS